MDLTAVTTAIGNAESDIISVGTLIIGVAAAVFAFRWVKAAFF